MTLDEARDRPMTPEEIGRYCPACDPDFTNVTVHSRSCRTVAADPAGPALTAEENP